MQTLPAATKSFHRKLIRRQRKQTHSYKCGYTYQDKGAFEYVGRHITDIKALIPTAPRQHMQHSIKKCEQPAHAPESHQSRLIERLSQGRHTKRNK